MSITLACKMNNSAKIDRHFFILRWIIVLGLIVPFSSFHEIAQSSLYVCIRIDIFKSTQKVLRLFRVVLPPSAYLNIDQRSVNIGRIIPCNGFQIPNRRRLAFCNLFIPKLFLLLKLDFPRSFCLWLIVIVSWLFTQAHYMISINREKVKSQGKIGQIIYLSELCVVNASKGLCKIKPRRKRRGCNEGRCKTPFSLSYNSNRNTNAKKVENFHVHKKTMYFLLFHEKVQNFWER